MSEQHIARVQAQFGPSAAAYVACAGFASGDDLEQLLAWGALPRPGRVLDVATGGGHTALAFAGVARAVTAVDLTEPMLRAAARNIQERGAANVSFVAAEAERLPFREQAFDVVTCRIAPHHFADAPGAVRQIARALKEGGTFLLEDILGHDDPDAAAFITEVERCRDPSHVRAYRASEWIAFLHAAGFAVIDEAVIKKVRVWQEWMGMMRMAPADRANLERFVLEAPPARRAPFDFELSGATIQSFSDRLILLRARKEPRGQPGPA